MDKIDVFAHVLLPKYYHKMVSINADIPNTYTFTNIESLKEKKDDFKKFYVDTAILGNPKALELTINYFGIDHVLYGTDAPFGIMPNGATKEIEDAINKLTIDIEDKEKIYYKNINKLINEKERMI